MLFVWKKNELKIEKSLSHYDAYIDDKKMSKNGFNDLDDLYILKFPNELERKQSNS